MDKEQQEKLVEELKQRNLVFDQSVAKEQEALGNAYTKKEYTFSLTEKRRMLQHESIMIMIQQAIDDIINLTVLPRLGITPSQQIKVFYDASVGRLAIWVPKSPAVNIESPK